MSRPWGPNALSLPVNNQEFLPATLNKKGIPIGVQDYDAVFNGVNAQVLPSLKPYDPQINLKEGTTPPMGRLISLSKSENLLLKEYL